MSQIFTVIYIAVILGVGIFLTVKLNFFQFKYFFRAFKDVFKTEKGNSKGFSPFQAASTALAGTLGTGNIIGVATAISSGGAGAVLWMCLSSLFSMATKFSEIVLSVIFRTENKKGEIVGGPMYYIKNGMKSPLLASLFSVSCVLASYGVGNLTQANAVSVTFYETFGTPKMLSGVMVALIVGLIILGGMKRVGRFTETLIPVMGATYIIGALIAIIINIKALPSAVTLIVKDAFSYNAVSGGIFGFLTKEAIRFGISRGVFSNEAGMGSSPIAHGSADTNNAVKQGFWGIIEVFLDTVLMCTVTAFVLLTAGEISVTAAFSKSLGNHAGIFVAISTFFFATAGIVGWAYYGEKAIEFLTENRKWILFYRISFVFMITVGAMAKIDFVFNFSDLLNLIMAVPNSISLLCLYKIILKEKNNYFEK